MKTAVAIALLSLASTAGADETTRSMSKFSAAGRAQISKAASNFVVGEDGVWWDRQIEARKESADKPTDAELDAMSDTCACAPLWFSAATGQALRTPEDVRAVSVEVMTQEGCSGSKDRFVCTHILGNGRFVVRRWKDNSAAQKAHLDAITSWQKRRMTGAKDLTRRPSGPVPDAWLETHELIILTGHRFRAVDEAVDAPVVMEKGTEAWNGAIFRLIEVCPAPETKARVRTVTPEELAEAILGGSARLTDWRYVRGADDIITWRSRDVTPTPTEAKIAAAPAPTRTSGPAPKQRPKS